MGVNRGQALEMTILIFFLKSETFHTCRDYSYVYYKYFISLTSSSVEPIAFVKRVAFRSYTIDAVYSRMFVYIYFSFFYIDFYFTN